MSKNVYKEPFYVPPLTSAQFNGQCPSGQIILFKDNNWNSPSFTIDTNKPQYSSGNHFSFSGSSLQDNATWIVFNLPKNVVCTLCNNVVQNSNPYDFSGAGVCVDLIGNGEIQTIDLVAYGANDCLSGGIWRKVDLSQGWFQLFYDVGEQGTFATIFLSEWPSIGTNSISSWWLQDKASSVSYPCLIPPQLLKLSDNANGSGQSIYLGASNPYGQSDIAAVVDLPTSGMNDKVSSFSYNLISPVKTVIDSISIEVSSPILSGKTITETLSGTNATSQVISITDTVAANKTVTISNTTTQEYQTTASISTSIEASEGIPDVASVKSTLTASFSVSDTSYSSQTTTNEDELDLDQDITFNVPPESTYSGVWNINIGKIPPTTVTQNGEFYYSQRLPGSVEQPDGTYMLTTPITVVITGNVGSSVQFNVKSTPINQVLIPV
jgi:hypothetical protein